MPIEEQSFAYQVLAEMLAEEDPCDPPHHYGQYCTCPECEDHADDCSCKWCTTCNIDGPKIGPMGEY